MNVVGSPCGSTASPIPPPIELSPERPQEGAEGAEGRHGSPSASPSSPYSPTDWSPGGRIRVPAAGEPSGPSILITVHQPSHRLLESVAGMVVMGPRGTLLYCGPRRDVDGRCALSRHFDGDGLRLTAISGNPAESLLEAMGDMDSRVQRRLERIAERQTERMRHEALLGGGGNGACGDDGEASAEVAAAAAAAATATAAYPAAITPGNDGVTNGPGTSAGGGGATAAAAAAPTVLGSWRMTLLPPQTGRARLSDRAVWRRNAQSAGFVVQMGMLCARQARHVVRHPMLLWVQLGTTAAISVLCGLVFYQLDMDLDTGVLTRVGLVFFLGLYFMLTALAPLPFWSQERLLYFQERAANCYGPLSYVLARTLYDGLLQRILPALLCAAMVPDGGALRARPCRPGARRALHRLAVPDQHARHRRRHLLRHRVLHRRRRHRALCLLRAALDSLLRIRRQPTHAARAPPGGVGPDPRPAVPLLPLLPQRAYAEQRAARQDRHNQGEGPARSAAPDLPGRWRGDPRASRLRAQLLARGRARRPRLYTARAMRATTTFSCRLAWSSPQSAAPYCSSHFASKTRTD